MSEPWDEEEQVKRVRARMNEGRHDIGNWMDAPPFEAMLCLEMRKRGMDPNVLNKHGLWHDAALTVVCTT